VKAGCTLLVLLVVLASSSRTILVLI
jgi:hypothetical protein